MKSLHGKGRQHRDHFDIVHNSYLIEDINSQKMKQRLVFNRRKEQKGKIMIIVQT